jgi:hypothetical protein
MFIKINHHNFFVTSIAAMTPSWSPWTTWGKGMATQAMQNLNKALGMPE